jgi:hypothetical protein
MADLLAAGENALTFPPGDLHECRRALLDFATLPAERLRLLGERLRATILRDCRHDLEASRYESLLAETLGRAPRAAAATALTES